MTLLYEFVRIVVILPGIVCLVMWKEREGKEEDLAS